MSVTENKEYVQPIVSDITCDGSTGSPPKPGQHTTDVVYQEVRLYIEGVQVPFDSIHIDQSIGNLPRAQFSVPPQSGLMDICRYYEPKVHVFYEDQNYGGFRLLFWGHIVASSFSHSRRGDGSAAIRFEAEHKNALLRQVTLDLSGYINPQNPGDVGNGQNVVVNALNSQFSILRALTGINGIQTLDKDFISVSNPKVGAADETKLMKSHGDLLMRVIGMPAVSMNFWNQIKKDVYSKGNYNSVVAGMLIPLIEDGIGYFKRMSGHPTLEYLLNFDRQQVCLHSGTEADIIIPPALKSGLPAASQAKIAVQVAHYALQFSGELTDYLTLLETFYHSTKYELVTLASPAEIPIDYTEQLPDFQEPGVPVMAVETIIKPQLPFYYAPSCNVLFPRMYHTIQVQQTEADVPTRVGAAYDSMPTGAGGLSTNFRGPHSVREAIAYAASHDTSITTNNPGKQNSLPTLVNTMSVSYNIPGKYEQGKGIIPYKVGLPQWLQTLSRDENAKTSDSDVRGYPKSDTDKYKEAVQLAAAWQARYGYGVEYADGVYTIEEDSDKNMLNPYSVKSGIYPYQGIMFSSMDYMYAEKVAGSRTGVVECLFNPYIVPGYPMDVIDDSPNHPSFHALCTSVSHTITARSISTTVGMSAVQTYGELSNYFTPPTPPWLQLALGIIDAEGAGVGASGGEYGSTKDIVVKNPGTLLFNVAGKTKADSYYRSVLGVAAADPSTLMDWKTGQAIPQMREEGSLQPGVKTSIPMPNGGDANDYNTSVGNLRLVSRPIESLDSIQTKFKYKFIDLDPVNYGGERITFRNEALASDTLLEPGASPFLAYMSVPDYIRTIAEVASGKTSSPIVEDTTTSDAISRRYGTQ